MIHPYTLLVVSGWRLQERGGAASYVEALAATLLFLGSLLMAPRLGVPWTSALVPLVAELRFAKALGLGNALTAALMMPIVGTIVFMGACWSIAARLGAGLGLCLGSCFFPQVFLYFLLLRWPAPAWHAAFQRRER